MQQVLTAIALIPLIILAASYLGVLHPLGDSLAVFRGVLAAISVLSLLLLLALRNRVLLLVGGALVLWSAYTVTPAFQAVAAVDFPYSLYQKNLFFRLPDHAPFLADVQQQTPDFITLQEVHRRNQPILSALARDYPAQQFCDFNGIGGEAVLSRWPVVAGTKHCFERRGVAMMQVTTPDGPVWLVSLHLHWPYPHGQATQVDRLLPRLAALDGPVVLGGDFNMVPWSHTMRRITGATRTRRVGRVHITFSLFDDRLKLPIDHVLVSGGEGDVSRRPRLGSDHYGLLARFSIQ